MSLDRRILAVTILAAAGAAGTLWLNSAADTGAESARPSQQYRWPVGANQRYALQVDSNVEIDGGSAGSYAHSLAGELRMQVFSRDERGVELGCQLQHVQQTVDGDDRPEPLLESFFVVRAHIDGRFADFEFPKTLDAQTRQRLREALRMFQVVVPAGAGESWTTREEDANGTFSAVYRVGHAGRIKKSRVEYADPSARILKSKSTALLATDGGAWLDTMDVLDAQRITSKTGQKVFVSAKAALRRISNAPAWTTTATARLATEATAVRRVTEIVEQKQTRAATDADRERVRALIAELDGSGKLGDFLAKMQALLDDCPELADMIPDRIAQGDLADLTASALIHVLAMSGSARAQTALISIATDARQTKQNQLRAVIDVGGVARPQRIVSDHLWALTAHRSFDAEMANTAILALGRIGKTLREQRSSDYAELSEGLQAALRASMSPGEKSAVLAAVANTRDPSFVSEAAIHLGAPTPQERGAAAKALAHLPGSREVLRNALELEKDPYVRSCLAQGLVAAGEPTEQTLALANSSITRESDADTRFALARYLGENLETYPQGRATLERLLETETNNRIRKYVAGRLYAKQ